MEKNRVYFCIDLKSFYASVECAERGYDPFSTNLVVADSSRGKGAICLAISPALKKLGVKNRCRLYEIPSNIKYEIVKPRMKKYMEKSIEIYSIYLKFFCSEDILVYSVDECFIDVTEYLNIYNIHVRDLVKKIIDEIYFSTGVTASAGIGTNLFLAKVALDVTAKYSKQNIGYLDNDLFKEMVWHYKPLTDIWGIGPGIAKRLEKMGITDLYGIATCDEQLLYREFGVNAELLIDHAKGIEPCTIKDVHHYKSKNNCLSNSQILFENYTPNEAIIVLKEMVEQMSLSLVEKDLITDSISLSIGYEDKGTSSTGGMCKLNEYTNSYSILIENFLSLFNKFVKKDCLIRKISIGVNHVISQDYITFDIFLGSKKTIKENSFIKSIVEIKNKYGKNSIMKGVSYTDKATLRLRNKLIGGHNSGEDENV